MVAEDILWREACYFGLKWRFFLPVANILEKWTPLWCVAKQSTGRKEETLSSSVTPTTKFMESYKNLYCVHVFHNQQVTH